MVCIERRELSYRGLKGAVVSERMVKERLAFEKLHEIATTEVAPASSSIECRPRLVELGTLDVSATRIHQWMRPRCPRHAREEAQPHPNDQRCHGSPGYSERTEAFGRVDWNQPTPRAGELAPVQSKDRNGVSAGPEAGTGVGGRLPAGRARMSAYRSHRSALGMMCDTSFCYFPFLGRQSLGSPQAFSTESTYFSPMRLVPFSA